MRSAPLLAILALLSGGCSRAAAPAPAPAPPAAPALPAVQALAPAAADEVRMVCVVKEGRLTEVPVVRDPATGEALYEGRRFRDAFPDTLPFARQQPWYITNEHLEYRGRRLVRWGLPRVLQPGDLEPVGEYRGVALFAEAGRAEAWDNVWVAVRPGCEFQWYKYTALARPIRG